MTTNPPTAGAERETPGGPTGPSRRRRRTLLVGSLVTAGLAGAMLVPEGAYGASPDARSVATVTASANDVTAQYSRGFLIYNLSSHPLKLINISGDGKFEGRPADGAVLMPGVGYHDIEVQWVWLSNQANTATYAILGDGGKQIGTFKAHVKVYGGDGGTESSAETTVGSTAGGGRQLTGAAPLTVLDAPGTVRDIPASEGQAQAATLKQLCDENNSATCTFDATKREKITGPEHKVGRGFDNRSALTAIKTLAEVDTVGVTDSVGVGLTVGTSLFNIVDVELSAQYNHEWSKSEEFSESVEVEVPPWYKVWLTDSAPLFRDTGDFTITLGNTTWRLHDVYFDSPDPNGNGTWTLYSAKLDGQQQRSTTLTRDAAAAREIILG